MTRISTNRRARLGTALAALALSVGTVAVASPAAAAPRPGTFKPTGEVLLSTGEGQMITLPSSVTDVWTSNPGVADVYVTNARQINLFGKEGGEATVIATGPGGKVVYATNVRVSQNITSVDEMLRAAMPNAKIKVLNAGQIAVLTGTVGSPDEAAQAEHLVSAMLNPGVNMSAAGAVCKICVVNRLTTSTPLQVMLKVKIAEVSRSLLKQWGLNLLTSDPTGGFQFGVAQGQGIHLPNAADPDDTTVPTVIRNAVGTTLSGSGSLFGLDILASLDLAEVDGLVSVLAEPNLTALSGETASFLAGGEFPVPISQSLGSLSIEYKQYGVGLAFTPIVLADGRISMRVRPEVSELTNEGSIRLNGFEVPGLTTRRAETTVELGSGQSFMIAGLLKNTNTNSIDKAPFLGDLPILGMLFRSTRFRRAETELVIVVTPYLVRPVSNQLATPIDGYRAPTHPQQIIEGQNYLGVSGRAPAAAPAPALNGAAAGTAATASPGFKL
jgi:pilus assembly protein CpaC